jgi:hypothetical protein
VGLEDSLQAPSVHAPGDSIETAPEERGATGRDRETRDRARERDGETDDDDGEVGVDERGRVDLEGPPLGMGESSSSLSPPTCLRMLSSALGGTPVPRDPRRSASVTPNHDGGRSRGSRAQASDERPTARAAAGRRAGNTRPRPAGSLTPGGSPAAELEALIARASRRPVALA